MFFARFGRVFFLIIAAGCAAMLAFGLYLQHVVGLEPCPMCIVQRYIWVFIMLISIITSIFKRFRLQLSGVFLIGVNAALGVFVAGRQSWLQWYPPEVVSCGRDLYGMIETFPLQRLIPMIFKGSGDCTAIDWIFLGGSIANRSFICFLFLALILIFGVAKSRIAQNSRN